MRLKIGDDFLDQYDDTTIAQTFAVSEIGSISNKNGGYSNKFRLPLTATNSELLGYPGEVNNTSRNPYTKFDVDLVDRGAVIAKGYLKYTIVDHSKQEIQCTFFSDNSDWISAIKSKNLKDLDLTEFSHTLGS